jgi:hypothetical protein
MQDEMSCAEFREILVAAADEMAEQWRRGAADAPQMFAPQMPAQDWWRHFTTVCMPERILALTDVRPGAAVR